MHRCMPTSQRWVYQGLWSQWSPEMVESDSSGKAGKRRFTALLHWTVFASIGSFMSCRKQPNSQSKHRTKIWACACTRPCMEHSKQGPVRPSSLVPISPIFVRAFWMQLLLLLTIVRVLPGAPPMC
ncbi:hypothetical protein COCSUDRAFT_54288 [Coccomyxa subellipsoidea C-169]|uniref:Uncharacterized protein n=1 Tax=Coccomyxa subellipsoidea (strain C-169) TaxID=574566 RepID=I0YRC2_COCSC|nr:hypothetical protein COCSUDRAFT_54288 [Coccomyxa subellipsoidea C-169]EIE20941.1 hypothetical protein COCSUDRAFT_54288 [Coccomyxa subellipsoidea C-169]|eukprot:XP_005645485.1 hypothetical protein COCSUDRAFT_54288 [Coccomyxa subellipsoidea C-169]